MIRFYAKINLNDKAKDKALYFAVQGEKRTKFFRKIPNLVKYLKSDSIRLYHLNLDLKNSNIIPIIPKHIFTSEEK